MKTLLLRFVSICLLCAAVLTGCASGGSEFLGKWVNTRNPNDTFQVMRNSGEYLIVSQGQKPGMGAVYKDGALEVKGALMSMELTYVKRTDTIVGPGFSARSNTGGRDERTSATAAPAASRIGRGESVNTP